MNYWSQALLAVAMLAVPVTAQTLTGDSAQAAKVVEAFHTAVKAGNPAAAMKLIADDAIFLESGGIETRAEYESNHLPADIDFEKAVPVAYKTYKVVVNGNSAWITTTAEMRGTFEGSSVNSALVETAILSKQSGQWKIRAMHWSSRRIPPRP